MPPSPSFRFRHFSLLAALLVLSSCASSHKPPPASTPIVIKIIAFNDFHGNINPPTAPTRIPDPQGGEKPLELSTGGIEYLSALIGQLRSQNNLNAVVAAGDIVGGAPLVSTLFHHEPTVEMVSKAGLEFSSVGNHEFDAGRTELLRMQHGGCLAADRGSCVNGKFAGAQYKYLAANVIDRQTRQPMFPPYAIKEFKLAKGGALRVAFIGLVLKGTSNMVIPSGIAGLDFADEADTANSLLPQLRARGIETIVVLIHEGGQTTATTFDDATCPGFTGPIKDIVDRLDPAIDLVVSGHTHRAYLCRYGGRLVTSAGAEGRYVTDIDLTIDPATKNVTLATARQLAAVNDRIRNPLPDRYPTLTKDARLTPLVEFYNAQAAPLAQREVGKMAAEITRQPAASGESALGDLIADAQLLATRTAGAQMAFMNRGGIRTDLRASGGVVTYNDVFSVHPFGNGLITLSLSGTQIRALLEQQWLEADTVLQVSNGFSYAWDAAAPPGSRVDIRNIRLNGTSIDPARLYRVTVNEFLAQGGDGFAVLKDAVEGVRGTTDVDALEKYISQHSPLTAPSGNRIVRRN